MNLGLGIYGSALGLALPALLPVLALHPRLRGGWMQRLGRPPRASLPRGAVWFHGSSAGDVVALLPLIARLRQAGFDGVLSTWTRSGQQLAERSLGDGTGVFRAPLDLALPVHAVLGRLRPRAVVLECLELWPRLVMSCHRRRVPVVVVNGRLSVRSLRRYQKAPWLFDRCFASLALVTALCEQDAARFVSAGVAAERVIVAGSSKHARAAEIAAGDGDDHRGCCRLVLGSVHRAEEATLLPWLPELLRVVRPQVVVAPRYPHRAAGLARRLRRLGVATRLASQESPAVDRPGEVLVVDRMGSLADRYRGARVAFVGGSLVARGGHNVVEPAAHGAFVITGPHLEHCEAEAGALQRAGAAAVVRDGREFFELAQARLLDDRMARQTAQASRRVVAELGLAADRIADRLLSLLGTEATDAGR